MVYDLLEIIVADFEGVTKVSHLPHLVPVQILNLRALWRGFRLENGFMTEFGRCGLVTLIGAVLVSLLRYAFDVEKVLAYPPAFALLFIWSSPFYLSMQVLGIVLLVAGFLLVHREAVSGRTQGPEDVVLGNQSAIFRK